MLCNISMITPGFCCFRLFCYLFEAAYYLLWAIHFTEHTASLFLNDEWSIHYDVVGGVFDILSTCTLLVYNYYEYLDTDTPIDSFTFHSSYALNQSTVHT